MGSVVVQVFRILISDVYFCFPYMPFVFLCIRSFCFLQRLFRQFKINQITFYNRAIIYSNMKYSYTKWTNEWYLINQFLTLLINWLYPIHTQSTLKWLENKNVKQNDSCTKSLLKRFPLPYLPVNSMFLVNLIDFPWHPMRKTSPAVLNRFLFGYSWLVVLKDIFGSTLPL